MAAIGFPNHFRCGMELAVSVGSCGEKRQREEVIIMEAGAKLALTTAIRSAKTGQLLPKEGTLLSVTQNLGRTLLLVEFSNGQSEYLFENEVELQPELLAPIGYSLGDTVRV